MNNLQDLRQDINDIDKTILELLQKRFEVTKKIRLLKTGVEIEDKEREQELFAMYKRIGDNLGLDEEFVRIIFKEIINESKNIQGTI